MAKQKSNGAAKPKRAVKASASTARTSATPAKKARAAAASSEKSARGTTAREKATATRATATRATATQAPSPRATKRSALPDRRAAATEALAIPTTPSAASAMRGKYVYCIVRTSEPVNFGAIGIGAEPAEVYTISFRDLAAVVSDTALVVHDPTRENVLAHQGVAEKVMNSFTVIPMSFGTVFKTRDDIVELLRSAYDAFRDVLDKMQDKFEFGLKVLWDRDQIVKEIEREDENVRRLKDEIAAQKGSTYFARMQYGRLVDATLQARTEQYVTEVFQSLRDVAVASRTNKPIGDKMILNAAFLVSRDRESAFDTRVKEIGQRYDGKLLFKYTGPWPPYNFVNIRLKLERAT
ncbi:MAG: GvpL/GvpF family gas vesicle protein [Myxococcota bacterium]|nr:GvpL/GvpF family gas vesicle protein [Myxococcota bacterium]